MSSSAKMKITFPVHVTVQGLTQSNMKSKMKEVNIPLLFPSAKGKTVSAYIRVVVENDKAELVAYECVLEVSGVDGKVSLQTVKKEYCPPAFLDSLLASASEEPQEDAEDGEDSEDTTEPPEEEEE